MNLCRLRDRNPHWIPPPQYGNIPLVKGRTRELLYLLLWTAGTIARPTFRNLLVPVLSIPRKT